MAGPAVQYNSDRSGRTNIRSRCAQMLNSSYGATAFDRLVSLSLFPLTLPLTLSPSLPLTL